MSRLLSIFLPFFFLPLFLEAREKICLNMIVKNESRVIRRCLDSVKPLIDYWVIVDTGSTDGTQEIIKSHLKDIPGELHERPWKNYGENRNEALALASGKGDYFLIMDADDWLEFDQDFQMPPLTHDLYLMRRGSKVYSNLSIQLIRACLPWKWVGVVHETIICDQPHTRTLLEKMKYVSGCDGGSYEDPEKYHRYAKLLEEELKKGSDNRRNTFYLGNTYKAIGEYTKAMECYEKRVALGGDEQEVFVSLLQIALTQKLLGFPLDTVIDSFYRAHRYRPQRVEPIYYLAEIYNNQSNYAMAYETLASNFFISGSAAEDGLFNYNWIKEYGLFFQLSICSYYLGHYKQSLDLCDLLLDMDLQENWRNQVIFNRGFALQKLESSEATSKISQEIFAKAESFRAENQLHLALKCYEEVVQIAKNQNDLFNALFKMAVTQEALKMAPEAVIAGYRRAHLQDPSRIEPLYQLSAYYKKQGLFKEAYETALKGLDLSVPCHPNEESIWIHEYGMIWQFSTCASLLGKFDEAIGGCQNLLNHPKIPEKNRLLIKEDLSTYKARQKTLSFSKEKWGTPPWEKRYD